MSFLTKAKGLLGKKVNVGSDIMKIDTLIGRKTSIDGHFTVSGNCKIDGAVTGEITVSGDLVIGKSAVITGNISAVNVIVAGGVNGDISAKGQLTVKDTAKVRGEHTVGSLIADEGAVFVGNCKILEREE